MSDLWEIDGLPAGHADMHAWPCAGPAMHSCAHFRLQPRQNCSGTGSVAHRLQPSSSETLRAVATCRSVMLPKDIDLTSDPDVSSTAIDYNICRSASAFLRTSTQAFDASHDMEHAQQVMLLAFEIANSTGEKYDGTVLMLAALLHDVCDHKYSGPEAVTKTQLQTFLAEQTDETIAYGILHIIDHISFSKQDKGLGGFVLEPLRCYIEWIRDADRLEAIGERGLLRCQQFTLARGGKVPADVVQHCKDKLLRLYPEKFIVTEHARQLALPRHQELERYVRAWDRTGNDRLSC